MLAHRDHRRRAYTWFACIFIRTMEAVAAPVSTTLPAQVDIRLRYQKSRKCNAANTALNRAAWNDITRGVYDHSHSISLNSH